MSARIADPDRLWTEDPHTTLERTLIAEYLLSKGYLMSELENLPLDVAKSLMNEACRFAALRLAEIEARGIFHQKIKSTISGN